MAAGDIEDLLSEVAHTIFVQDAKVVEGSGAAFGAAPYHSAGVDSGSNHSPSEEGMTLEIENRAPRYLRAFASPLTIVYSWS